MRYIRTKDGRIVDVQKFIDETKDTPYYYDFKFDEIKNEGDSCVLNWTAIGTRENSIKEQVGKRCQFGVTIDSPFIAQADTIEKLCDEFVVLEYGIESGVLYSRTQHTTLEEAIGSQTAKHKCSYEIYGAIWTDKGLIYKAKINEKGDLELL